MYFNEAQGGKYVPRAVVVDLEPGVLDNIKAGPQAHLFRPDNMIFAQARPSLAERERERERESGRGDEGRRQREEGGSEGREGENNGG